MASKPSAPADRADLGRAGFTLVELVVAVLISGLLIAGLSGAVGNTLLARDLASERNRRIDDARFALDRMTRAIQAADRLFVPRPDNPGTPQDESVHDPGALAVTMDPTIDRDRNGIFDADNDGDGRFDEDPTGDPQGDLAPGVAGIDDDRDGSVDEQASDGGPLHEDDDEDDATNEDVWNGIDDDGDGWIDEDTKKDLTGEGVAGVPGVDDDGDSQIDEGDKNDDDEDGSVNEDWMDTVVFRLMGTELRERTPVPWDVNPPAGVDGADSVEQVLVDGVAQFRVVRLPEASADSPPRIELTLSLTTTSGNPITLTRLVSLGSAR